MRNFAGTTTGPPIVAIAYGDHQRRIKEKSSVDSVRSREDFPIIDPSAHVAASSHVSPGCRLARLVEVGENCSLASDVHLMRNVLVDEHTHIGPRTVVFPNAVLGYPPQDRKYGGGPTQLVIGADCVLREGSKIERGTEMGGGVTRLGSSVLIMAGVYIGHDSFIEDGVVVANNSSVAGHCHLSRGCVVGGHTAIHQHVRVGRHAMVGGMTALRRDVLPYTVVSGSPPILRGLNFRQLWPTLGFYHRRAALSMYHFLFPFSKARSSSFPAAFPRVPQNSSLQDRFLALSRVDVSDIVDFHRRAGSLRKGIDHGGNKEYVESNCSSEKAQTGILRMLFHDMSTFALQSSGQRGLYVS